MPRSPPSLLQGSPHKLPCAPPSPLIRLRLSDGRVLLAGGSPSNPSAVTLGRAHVGRGAKKRLLVSREACLVSAAAGNGPATVSALASAKAPVVLERRVSFSASTPAAALQRLPLRPGDSPRALRDKDVIQLCPGDDEVEDEEEARRRRVVVEVISPTGAEEEREEEQQEKKESLPAPPPPPPPQQQQPQQQQPPPPKQQQQQQQQRKQNQQQQQCSSLPPLIMLVLVGLPGSGKTSLAEALTARANSAVRDFDDNDGFSDDDDEDGGGGSDDETKHHQRRSCRSSSRRRPREWVRVSQDALRGSGGGGGGGGGGAARLSAERALSQGFSVVADRTNLTREQRAPFLALARRYRAEPHALYLKRPRRQCMERAFERAEHEGGVRDRAAVGPVLRMASVAIEEPSEGPPESFARVRVLLDDAANDAAAEEYGEGRVKASGGGESGGSGGGGGRGGGGGGAPSPATATATKRRSAFDVLMSPPTAKRVPGVSSSAPAPAPRRPLPPFLKALRLISENPEGAGTGMTRVAGEETGAPLLVLRDKFPKARSHALVMQETAANVHVIASARDLGPSDAALVRDMLAAGRRWAASEQQREGSKSDFRFGFHSVPSLEPMHLHAISQDLLGTSLKTKKHYNSFKSPFFVDAEEVLEALGKGDEGTTQLLPLAEAERALAAPLECHRCRARMRNMPTLRAHLEEHERSGE